MTERNEIIKRARDDYEREIISLREGRNIDGGERIANAIESLYELLALLVHDPVDSPPSRSDNDPTRIARTCLNVVRSPGIQQLGAPGSVMREAWDLGREFEQRALASHSVSTETYQAQVERADGAERMLERAERDRDLALEKHEQLWHTATASEDRLRTVHTDVEAARRERDEVRADNEKLKSALDRITKAMSETP